MKFEVLYFYTSSFFFTKLFPVFMKKFIFNHHLSLCICQYTFSVANTAAKSAYSAALAQAEKDAIASGQPLVPVVAPIDSPLPIFDAPAPRPLCMLGVQALAAMLPVNTSLTSLSCRPTANTVCTCYKVLN